MVDTGTNIKVLKAALQIWVRLFSFAILSLVSVSACQTKVQGIQNGAVIKGPLQDALVFLDYNLNGILDGNEPFSRTNAEGSFNLNGRSGYSITVKTDEQTIDTSSGEVLSNITLKAPSGSAIISPTTTIMEESGLAAEEVGFVLGLPEGIDPTQFNPFAEGVDPDQALAVEQIAHQVMNTVTAISSAVEGAGGSIEDAFMIALDSVVDVVQERALDFKENPLTPVNTIDFTDMAEIDVITTKTEEKMEQQGIGDKAAFQKIKGDIDAALTNVNTSVGNVTDIISTDSKATFALSSELKSQIKIAAEDPDANRDKITFINDQKIREAKADKILEIQAREAEDGEPAQQENASEEEVNGTFEIPDAFSGQFIVQAGEVIHIDYNAIDAETKVRSVEFQFVNEIGNSISISDYDQDGIASRRISTDQMNGTYSLKTITVRDDGYNSNGIEYKEDGTTQFYDNVNHTWVYGEHTFDFTTMR